MVDPVLGVRLAVQRGRLYVDSLVRGIEVDVADRGRLAGHGRGDVDAVEIWRRDEVDVLPWIWEQPHHGEDEKAPYKYTHELVIELLNIQVEITVPIAPESSFPGKPGGVGVKKAGI